MAFCKWFSQKPQLLASFCTGRASAEELQLVVEIAVTGGKLNLFLELVHRAGSFDGFNGSAIRADQVITMLAGEQ